MITFKKDKLELNSTKGIMNFKRSQTATEYIVIVAVVIVIALVLVQIMGGFPGIGSGTSKKVSDYKLARGSYIGIDTYYFNTNSFLAQIRNNHFESLTLNNLTVDGTVCTSANTNLSGTSSAGLSLALNPGQQVAIICGSTNFTSTQDSGSTPSVSVTYTDLNGYSHSELLSGSSIYLSGISNPETILNSSYDPFSVVGSSYTFRMTTPNATLRFGSTDILVVSISSPSIGITWDYLGAIGSPLNITDTDPHYYTINSINYTIAFIGNGSRIFSVIVGGNGTPITYNCTGSIPANAQICSGDNLNLTNNTANSVVANCGTPKCEYICDSGFIISGNNCINPIRTGLVAYYPLDGNTSDGAGISADATNNGATYTSAGRVGGAYSFDGLSNYINSASNLGVTGTTTRTVSFWFKPANRQTRQDLFGWGTGGTNGYRFSMLYDYATNDEGVYYSGYGGPADMAGSSNSITRNAWNFVTLTYDGARVVVYINNNPTPNINFSNTLATQNSPLYIAKNVFDGSNFEGVIDEFAVWNRALNYSEISSLYNNGTGVSLSLSGAYAPDCIGSQTGCNGTNSLTCSNKTWVNNGNIEGICGYVAPGNVTQLRNGLVVYYAFDGNTSDLSGNGNNGSNGVATYTASGRVGGAYSFDGVSNYIASVNNLGVTGTATRTVSFWIKPANRDGRQDLFGWGIAGTGNRFSMLFDYTPHDSIYYSGYGGTADMGGSAYSITRNAWNFITLTYDGSRVLVYLNNITTPHINFSNVLTTQNSLLYVGKNVADGSPFEGIIDEFTIWNRALNTTEILKLYNSGNGMSLSLSGAYAPNCTVGQTSCSGTNYYNCTNGNMVNNGDVSGFCGYVAPGNIAQLRQGLFAYYPLDGNTSDMSGNGKHGTNFGATNATGKVNGSLSFNGGGNYVSVPDYTGGANNMTVNVWVKLTSGNYYVIGGHPTINNVWFIGTMGSGGVPTFRYKNGGEIVADGTVSIADGNWHFLTGVTNTTTGQLYVDGVLKTTINTGGNWGGGPIRIATNPGNEMYFGGLIDEITIYNRTLTSIEILQLYNSSNGFRLVQ